MENDWFCAIPKPDVASTKDSSPIDRARQIEMTNSFFTEIGAIGYGRPHTKTQQSTTEVPRDHNTQKQALAFFGIK